MAECRDKNMIDKDEYPRTAELEQRCVAILADLWNAPDPSAAVGCSTTGSSEACMLAGMALKRRWSVGGDRYPGTARPNLVMGVERAGVLGQVLQLLGGGGPPGPDGGRPVPPRSAGGARAVRREHHRRGRRTRSTFDGSYEPVAEVCAALDALQARTGLDVPCTWTVRPAR